MDEVPKENPEEEESEEIPKEDSGEINISISRNMDDEKPLKFIIKTNNENLLDIVYILEDTLKLY